MAIPRGTDAQVLGANASGGLLIGATSSDLVGFYGTAGVDQPAAITSVNTTAATSTTLAFGYTTSTQADAIVTAINSILSALREVGLIDT
jgi:hypothetical protein